MSDEQSSTGPAHQPGARKGEELASKGEAGRDDHGDTHADRPAGGSSARMSTSINADKEEPIDPSSPTMPPP
ncbi:MAG: hypothetical protein ACJ78Q_09975 [Chloroflexia bacterium]